LKRTSGEIGLGILAKHDKIANLHIGQKGGEEKIMYLSNKTAILWSLVGQPSTHDGGRCENHSGQPIS
jgi:hypothetical protein